jgi:hypothetical protein
MMPGKGSKGKIDPSRARAAAGNDTGMHAGDRDDPTGLRGFAGGAGWHYAAADGGPVGDIPRHSSDDHDRSGCTSRIPFGTFDNSAVVEQLRHQPPPCLIRRRDWTTAVVSCQVGTSSVWFTCQRVCRTWNPAAANDRVPTSRHETQYPVQTGSWMTGRMIAPSAR